MNYEEFLNNFEALDKSLKDAIKKIGAIEKKIAKDAENGDYKNLVKDAAQLEVCAKAVSDSSASASEAINSFDSKEYFATGAFTEDVLNLLKESNLDVVGEYPVFEVFPTRIQIDAESEEVTLGKKKVPTMRPAKLVGQTKALIDKLEGANFNAVAFAQDLENAYAQCIAKDNEKAGSRKFTFGSYITLIDCYKMMVPLSRSRKEYDEVAFAFDLARLYNENESGALQTKSGHKLSFSSGRGKTIRILDKNGREQLFSTICFR